MLRMKEQASPSEAGGAAIEREQLPWGLAWRIAFGQVTAWGTLYYAFSIIVSPMQSGTGWSRSFLNGGLSLGLLVWGASAIPVGAWIQRRGGRGLMALGSFIGGAAFASMGYIVNPIAYMIEWVLLGFAMASLLYEPAFAVITAAFDAHYRRGITLITLVGGLASTVFIPLAHIAEQKFGWKGACIALGGLQVLIGVPLHYFGLPKASATAAEPLPSTPIDLRFRQWFTNIRADVTDRRFVGLAIWFTAHTAAFSGMTFQLIPILQSTSVGSTTILIAIALIGPMQVIGRIALATKGQNFQALQVGRWAMSALISSVIILAALPSKMPWLAFFAVLYGAGNGVITILRGTSVAELFGRDRYAELNGFLAAPAVLAKAASPLVLAVVWSATNTPMAVSIGLLIFLILGVFGLEMARRSEHLRRPERSI